MIIDDVVQLAEFVPGKMLEKWALNILSLSVFPQIVTERERNRAQLKIVSNDEHNYK